MNPILRNILAVIAGLVIGGFLNGFLASFGPSIIPTPDGFDPKNFDTYGLLEAKHMIFPFLAHALGTLLGAFIVAKFAANNNKRFALGIGVFFMIGGITMVFLVNAPLWFDILDLTLAYIPMGILGGRLGAKE